MKTFIFVCDVCNKEIEVPAGKRPPVCCRKIMRKKYTVNPVIFKGDGWAGKENK